MSWSNVQVAAGLGHGACRTRMQAVVADPFRDQRQLVCEAITAGLRGVPIDLIEAGDDREAYLSARYGISFACIRMGTGELDAMALARMLRSNCAFTCIVGYDWFSLERHAARMMRIPGSFVLHGDELLELLPSFLRAVRLSRKYFNAALTSDRKWCRATRDRSLERSSIGGLSLLADEESTTLEESTRVCVTVAFSRAQGNVSEAARLLEIGRPRCYRLLRHFGLLPRSQRDRAAEERSGAPC